MFLFFNSQKLMVDCHHHLTTFNWSFYITTQPFQMGFPLTSGRRSCLEVSEPQQLCAPLVRCFKPLFPFVSASPPVNILVDNGHGNSDCCRPAYPSFAIRQWWASYLYKTLDVSALTRPFFWFHRSGRTGCMYLSLLNKYCSWPVCSNTGSPLRPHTDIRPRITTDMAHKNYNA